MAAFDAALAAARAAGVRQVVLLAAGYDATAYRFASDGVRYFEVDLPAVSEAKRALVAAALASRGAARPPAFVGADLGRAPLGEALAGTGFDAAEPTLWMAQGLVRGVGVGGGCRSARARAAPARRAACSCRGSAGALAPRPCRPQSRG